jgi:ATP-binding cassette, subfamily B, bacterial
VLSRLRRRQEWQFLGVLPKAAPGLATAWWTLLVLRGLLPAGFAIAMGVLVGAVERGEDLAPALTLVGVVFVGMQVLGPIHQAVGANLGDRTLTWLSDQLALATTEPEGMAHLEHSELVTDLSMGREFELAVTGPPLSISMDFIASGFVELVAGVSMAAVLAGFAWWAPLVLGLGWASTHWLLRESGVWKDRQTDEVRTAQRHADYTYRLAVDPPSAKELRLFGLADWTVDRFLVLRRRLFDLQWQATRLRERSVGQCLVVVGLANVVVFWALASAAADGRLALDRVVIFASAAIGTNMVAFGGLSWALDFASAPAAATLRLGDRMAAVGGLSSGSRSADGMPAAEIRLSDVTFTYPTGTEPVLAGFDLTVPAGSSLAIVGQNGAGKTTLAKLLCRLYDPQSGSIEIDGVDLRDLDLQSWRARVTAVFQDFVRFEWPLRDNVAPSGADDEAVLAALAGAGAADLADLDTILARGYPGGIDLSGGQWQRVALARALCAVHLGAGVVLLDEPTAQLDVRGEAEIFERVLAATRHCTTILVSHRFSTVRHADRICVIEGGRVVELGSHAELMAQGGRYRTMFDLQASRFAAGEPIVGEEEVVLDVLD